VSDHRGTLLPFALLLGLSVLACSIGAPTGESSKPIVEVLSPPSGSRVSPGEEVEVVYRASDPIAVVRVELEVEGQIVDSQSSPTSKGQPSLTGILRWTRTTAGVYTLLVYAYNSDDVVSEGVGVQIIVEEGISPEATATQVGEAPTGPMATVALSDDFSDPDSGWPTLSEDTYRLGYQGGEYFIEHVQRNDASRWQTYPDLTLYDFTAEVKFRFEAEDDYVGAALIWRWQDNDNFYVFRVCNTGEYDLFKRVGGDWQNLIPRTSSSHINSGIATNTLKVAATGDVIQIYVNDQHLADFTDSSLDQGRIGLYASVYTASPISTRVFFDDLKVFVSGEVPEVVPSPPAAMTMLAYSDDFDDPDSGWTVSSGEGYSHGYDGGEYFVEYIEQSDRARLSTYPDRTFSDFTAEVEVRFASDVESVFGGLVWRWQDNENFCRLRILNTGHYDVKALLEGEWQVLIDRASTPHINTGIATNRLKIVALGDQNSIYVNDNHLADFTDSSFDEGRIGVYAGVSAESPVTTRISFDNLRVYVSEPAEATPGFYPPPSGKLVFASNRDKPEAIYKEIYVMNVDGSGLTRLTNYEFDDAMPRWSPDGRHIAFVSWRDGNWEIYVMSADGSDVVRLTENPASDLGPRWSPDGQRIAFYSDRDGNEEIYLMGADGSGQINVSNNPAKDRVADWSPDGEWIAFCSDRGGDEDIYVMKHDGSEVINLTRNPAKDYAPSWSPDGQRIVFESDRRSEGNADIYVMDADGSGVLRLTDYAQGDSAAGWSPDGRYIHFSREVWGVQGRWEMYIMRADGSEQTNISGDPSVNFRDRDWSAGP
jgi:Tol biopolymer transport system component